MQEESQWIVRHSAAEALSSFPRDEVVGDNGSRLTLNLSDSMTDSPDSLAGVGADCGDSLSDRYCSGSVNGDDYMCLPAGISLYVIAARDQAALTAANATSASTMATSALAYVTSANESRTFMEASRKLPLQSSRGGSIGADVSVGIDSGQALQGRIRAALKHCWTVRVLNRLMK